jgi:tetratricopeptide (TPR) repeat protein
MMHMRYGHVAMVCLFTAALAVLLERGTVVAQPLPIPRRVADDDGDSSPAAEFERVLQKLRAEREGLSADWQALRKRNTAPEPSVEIEQKRFEMQMQKVLDDLRHRRLPTLPGPAPTFDAAKKKLEPDAAVEDKKPGSVPPLPEGQRDQFTGPVDIMAQAHTLMRSKQYEDALAAFQQVDLKGKKANERAPIQYLRACCLMHLGKSKDAAELLQDVANYKGDERLAGYAQSQLEMLRWQRDVSQRLQDIRQRHQAIEAGR